MSGGRWTVFVHQPEGDMGAGFAVGPVSEANVDALADRLRRALGETWECIAVENFPARGRWRELRRHAANDAEPTR